MAVSRNTGTGRRPHRSPTALPSLTRYDLVLVAIPLAFLATLLGHVVTGVSIELAIAGASLVAATAVTDALFLHPPLEDR
jgi:hypothetical protein